ncbi:MAG: hypothetical protein EPN84_13050 [Legionella sp.]|nr:MAG: hypothetical protein EPN84_13050 [Legionella sp.]
MLGIIRQLLLVIGIVLTVNVHAATQDYDLLPGKPLRVTIATTDALKVTCDMRMTDNYNHSLTIRMLNGYAVINGTSLKKGQSMSISIHHLQLIPIVAAPGTDVEFNNLGPTAIKALCTIL